jgi:hypothetical protein
MNWNRICIAALGSGIGMGIASYFFTDMSIKEAYYLWSGYLAGYIVRERQSVKEA